MLTSYWRTRPAAASACCTVEQGWRSLRRRQAQRTVTYSAQASGLGQGPLWQVDLRRMLKVVDDAMLNAYAQYQI